MIIRLMVHATARMGRLYTEYWIRVTATKFRDFLVEYAKGSHI